MGPDAAALAAAARQAERLRKDGNECYRRSRFGAAIDAYTEAITLCPKVPVYWTNRALCHRKRNDWQKVEEDSRKALQLDHDSVKAHYMLGLALLQKQEYIEGVKELERALDLGRGAHPRSYMVEEIWQELSKAKYLLWEQESTKRSWELQSLKYATLVYATLVLAVSIVHGIDFAGKITAVSSSRIAATYICFCYAREACEMALKEKFASDASMTEGFLDELAKTHLEQVNAVGEVFQKAAEADMPAEVPDYLCCKITLDIYRDPVITPSGITYERAVLLEHLNKVGKFDPITHEQLDPSQLVPNLAIKAAVQAYLDEHGWAYKWD